MDESLLDLLREGGYILYARHGDATVGDDQPNLDFHYCFTQRNLSETGEMQGVYYGDSLRKLHIPISYPIIASPYCRTIGTAQLAFGWRNIQVDPFWAEINRLSEKLSSEEQKRILDILTSKLEIIPPLGTNKVIIAHSFPDDIGLGQIPYMGTVVVKPLGPGNGYDIVGRFSLEDIMKYDQ
ncbi:histidine phosphatase family protein [Anaerocolumna aminovalerica]|uniref:Histidine phosphatase superfamily (Branch 1) n=1 Tax=Anaerocolumna aminovalerica TaxID=1527 RepID=A0A1I5CHP8_9FIRM|nr:histidine phosphatase family protein [Anaerocolumna aminovalerica]SFN86352.1 hypothetical protein SAMN04489757_10361 [Anaerocolumna aminovalerica]